MRRTDTSGSWGWFLLAFGLLVLLSNFGLLPGLSSVLWGALFALGGLLFLGLAARDARQWWAFIPGGALTGLALAVFSDGASWGGAAFLGSIGAGFLAVYGRQREHWWAILPGGVLLTLALTAAFPGASAGSLFFLGLAVTFLVLATLPAANAGGSTHRWAWYPAVAALVLSVVSGLWFPGAWGNLWPVLLIGLGGYLLLVPRRGSR